MIFRNKVIFYLMISDIFVITGFGLVEPIIAIFIKDNLIGGTIFTAGVASTIFLITKSITQLPFSRYVDKQGEQTDLRWLIGATLLITVVPFVYVFSTHIYHIFIAQFIYGIASGLAFATWLRIWSIHLDKGRESFEWSLYSTLVGVGTALSISVGAAIAAFVGFTATFILVGIMSLVGCGVLFHLRRMHPDHGQGEAA